MWRNGPITDDRYTLYLYVGSVQWQEYHGIRWSRLRRLATSHLMANGQHQVDWCKEES